MYVHANATEFARTFPFECNGEKRCGLRFVESRYLNNHRYGRPAPWNVFSTVHICVILILFRTSDMTSPTKLWNAVCTKKEEKTFLK